MVVLSIKWSEVLERSPGGPASHASRSTSERPACDTAS
jgi:hypothetical protein